MLATRTSAVLVGGGILAALIASPALMRTSPRTAAESTRPFATDTRRIEIPPTHIGALLAARAGMVQTTRNPFVFAPRPQPPAPAPPAPVPAIVETPAQPPRPAVTLAAIAEQTGDNGVVVRTAVLSVAGQTFLVKEGERATPRFTAVRISSDVVELRDETSGTLTRLALK